MADTQTTFDVECPDAWRTWLNDHTDASSNDEIVATANEALSALWGALDAVHHSRN